MDNIPESDWKHLRTIKDELLETLCKRINDEAAQIINDRQLSQHEKYLQLFSHVNEQDRIVGNCFNDWRRSKILANLVWLRRQNLLEERHKARLSEETQRKLEQLERL